MVGYFEDKEICDSENRKDTYAYAVAYSLIIKQMHKEIYDKHSKPQGNSDYKTTGFIIVDIPKKSTYIRLQKLDDQHRENRNKCPEDPFELFF